MGLGYTKRFVRVVQIYSYMCKYIHIHKRLGHSGIPKNCTVAMANALSVTMACRRHSQRRATRRGDYICTG